MVELWPSLTQAHTHMWVCTHIKVHTNKNIPSCESFLTHKHFHLEFLFYVTQNPLPHLFPLEASSQSHCCTVSGGHSYIFQDNPIALSLGMKFFITNVLAICGPYLRNLQVFISYRNTSLCHQTLVLPLFTHLSGVPFTCMSIVSKGSCVSLTFFFFSVLSLHASILSQPTIS